MGCTVDTPVGVLALMNCFLFEVGVFWPGDWTGVRAGSTLTWGDGSSRSVTDGRLLTGSRCGSGLYGGDISEVALQVGVVAYLGRSLAPNTGGTADRHD